MKIMTISELTSKDGLFCDGDWIEKKDQCPNGNVRLIQLADIGVCEFKNKSSRYVTEETANRLRCAYLHKGDILIARLPDPLGRACIFPFDGKYITAVDVAILRIRRDDVDTRYMMYMINSPMFRKQIKQYETGTTRKRISRTNLEKICFSLPRIEEQERIVAHIEKLFSQLDSGVETLKKTKQQVDVYRQAVLKEAFGSVSQTIPFGEITDARLGKMLDKEKNIGVPKPYLRNINVRWFSFDLADMLEMPFEEKETEKYSIVKGDLVICEGGEPGRCAVWESEDNVYYQKALHRVRVIDDSNPYFYMYYLWHAAKSGKLSPYYTGTGIKHLTGQSLARLPVPSIERSKQDAIVEYIEMQIDKSNRIETTIDESLSQAEAMKQSILKQAFAERK